jgi:hydrogenase assembly chaperone HypC/HupF
MCVGLPGKVTAVKKNKARVKQGDHFHWLDTSTLNQSVKVGDWLLSYQDAAINKISDSSAKEVLAILGEMNVC